MAGVGGFKALLRDLVGWRRLSPPRGASWEPLEMTSLESRAESKRRAIHS